MTRDGIEAAKTRLTEALTREGFAREAIKLSEGPGPFGTHAILAQADGAYPGTGARVALVDGDGTAYGTSFDKGVVAFVEARGWFESPPAARDLVTLVDKLALDGLLQLAAGSPPVLSKGDALELRFTRVAFPSGAEEPMLARIARSGFELRALPTTPEREPTPIDAATRLIRALDVDDGVAILGAIPALPTSLGDRDRAALARATMHPNEAIGTTALMKLGASEPSLAALREALKAAPNRRAEVVEWVSGLFDDQAARSL